MMNEDTIKHSVTMYDLSHRDKLMAPPLNLIVYVIGLTILGLIIQHGFG